MISQRKTNFSYPLLTPINPSKRNRQEIVQTWQKSVGVLFVKIKKIFAEGEVELLGKMDWLYTSTYMLWERFPTVLEKNGEKIYIPIVFCMALPHRHSGTVGWHIL